MTIPVVTSNRINMPQVAEEVLARGDADLVSMARPFLADPEWIRKAAAGRADEINTCIACNQACLDHVFDARRRPSACLVNPRAGRETELVLLPTRRAQARRGGRRRTGRAGRGGRPRPSAGTASSCSRPTDEIGGQFDIARRIPGKEEFAETIRYYTRQLELTGVELHLGRRVGAERLAGASTRSCSPPACRRGCPTSPASTTRWSSLRRGRPRGKPRSGPGSR